MTRSASLFGDLATSKSLAAKKPATSFSPIVPRCLDEGRALIQAKGLSAQATSSSS